MALFSGLVEPFFLRFHRANMPGLAAAFQFFNSCVFLFLYKINFRYRNSAALFVTFRTARNVRFPPVSSLFLPVSTAFHRHICRILPCVWPLIALQKVTFYKTKGHLLQSGSVALNMLRGVNAMQSRLYDFNTKTCIFLS